MSRSLNLFSDGITQLFRERGGSSVGGFCIVIYRVVLYYRLNSFQYWKAKNYKFKY